MWEAMECNQDHFELDLSSCTLVIPFNTLVETLL